MQKRKRANVKKVRKSPLVMKTFTICYFICLGLVYLTSNTEAKFTNTRVHNEVIQAGEWWDGSNLIFNHADDQIIESCEPVGLTVAIKNDSIYGMYGTTEYEVYRASLKEGGSFEIGEKVSDRLLETAVIKSGETSTLTYTVSTPGDYVFMAYQRPKYDEAERTSIMSEFLTVICSENESASQEERDPEESDDVLVEELREEVHSLLDKEEKPEEPDRMPEQNEQEDNSAEELAPNTNEEDKGGQRAEGDETDE